MKTDKLPNQFVLLHYDKKQIDRYFITSVFPSVDFFTKKTKHLDQSKAYIQIYKIVPISEINGLVTLHAVFLSLLQVLLNGYSIGDEYYLRKPDELPKLFSLLH